MARVGERRAGDRKRPEESRRQSKREGEQHIFFLASNVWIEERRITVSHQSAHITYY
jgi:hypothetical protein